MTTAFFLAILLASPGGPKAVSQDGALEKEIPSALKLLNATRLSAGLAPVTLDEELSRAARLHAIYLRENDGKPELEGLQAHHEVPGLPGYSELGANAGVHSDLNPGCAPLQAVANFVNSLYHRTPILNPALRKVGFGTVMGPRFPITVLMFDDRTSSRAGYPIRYPVDGQVDVPIDFRDEFPNPVPSGAGPVGSPVTVDFGPGSQLTKVEAHLLDSAGNDVPTYLSSPLRPATTFPQGGVVCMIAKQPLLPGARYTALVQAVDAEEGKRSLLWSFTTTSPIHLQSTDLAGLQEARGRLVLLEGDVLDTGKGHGAWFLRLAADPKTGVTVFVRDSAVSTFNAAGITGPERFSAQRVSVLTSLDHVNAAGEIEVEVTSPDQVRVLEVAPPLVDWDAPGASLREWKGKLIRVHGHVKYPFATKGYLGLELGWITEGAPTIFIEGAPKALLDHPDRLVGRELTARGAVYLHNGHYGINVDQLSSIVWTGPDPLQTTSATPDSTETAPER